MGWSQFFTGVLPLLGVLVGGFATYVTQTHILDKQLNREIERERKEKEIERLSIYCEILKLEGENEIIMSGPSRNEVFNTTAYVDQLRPVFYSKFYLLDQEVADQIRAMDRIIMEANFFEELGPGQDELLLAKYIAIIHLIEERIKDYRTID